MRPVISPVVVAMIVLAGCVAGENEATSVPSSETTASTPADAGTIRGTVTSEELAPIAAARLTISETEFLTLTGADGTFLLSGVPVGSHRVVAEAIGYQSIAHNVDVLAGEEAVLAFALAALEVIVPYKEVFILAGFTECVASAVFFTYYVTLPICSQQKHSLKIDVKDSWRYGILEQVWQGQTSMHFISDTNTNCGYGNNSAESCFFWRIGRSPMRLDAAPMDPKYVQWKMLYPDGAFAWLVTGLDAGFLQQEINGSPACDLAYQTYGGYNADCGGIGVGYPGYRFDLYASVYHHEAPPNPASESARPPK